MTAGKYSVLALAALLTCAEADGSNQGPSPVLRGTCPSILNGTSLGGGKHSIKKIPAKDGAACCVLCMGQDPEDSCTAYSWWLLHGKGMCNLFRGDATQLKRTEVAGDISGILAGPPAPPPAPTGAKNLLYLMVDDLRTTLGYRHPGTALTPHLDKLASQSATFTHAYCNHAVCAPSRNSFMSGLRPGTIKVWTFTNNFRTSTPLGETWVPHPEHYKRNGYLTLGGGKTYHPGRPKDYDEPRSWSQDKAYFPFSEEGCPVVDAAPANGYTRSLCVLDIAQDDTYDHRLANATIDSLRMAKQDRRPFSIFAGHRRPHVPWRLPRKWWDLYENRTVAPPTQPTTYTGAPEVAFTCGDQCSWKMWDSFKPPTASGQAGAPMANYSRGVSLTSGFASTIRRAYYAALSLMDDSIGRTLTELDVLGLTANTVVIFHADHGWGLGEGNLWHKFTNYEHSVRVPLLIRVPWLPHVAGSVVADAVELVDIYPTAAALTRSGPVANASTLDGIDFSPLLTAIGQARDRAVARPLSTRRLYTFSDFPRCDETGLPAQPTPWPVTAFEKNYCKSNKNSEISAMGYSVRSVNLRYTRWMRWDGTALAVKPDGWRAGSPSLLGEELYDHTGDDGVDFDAFPLGHANMVTNSSYTDALHTHRAALGAFFRDGAHAVAFAEA